MQPIPPELRDEIRRRMRERRTHGVAVCCFDTETIRFAGGVGHADLERAEAVDAATVFRVASISKLLTATLVLAAVDDGRIDLDRPANAYLPSELRITDPDGGPASAAVRSLLSHSSGLPSGTRGADLGNRVATWISNQGRVRDLDDAVRGLRVTRPAGERIVYSNPGYNVLGRIAAAVWDDSFEAAAQNRVLGPIGMDSSAFVPAHHGPGRATPYGAVIPPAVGPEPVRRVRLLATPMGGLSTNVVDLARFGRMVLNSGVADARRVVSGELVDEASTIQALNHDGLEQGYGLGFRVRRWRGRTLLAHDGNMPGVATQFLLSPEDGIGVVVLTNGYALSVPHEIALLTLARAAGAAAAPTEPDEPDARAVSVATEFGRSVEGLYRLDDPLLPGIAGRIGDLQTRVRVRHEVAGRLRVDGIPWTDGPVWLEPESGTGRYRWHAPVDDLTNAVVEDTPEGARLWFGYTGLLRRRSGPATANRRTTDEERR